MDSKLDRRRAARKKWALKNPGKAEAAIKVWQGKNRQKCNEATYKWRKRNPEKWSLYRYGADLRRKYGITHEDVARMLKEQNNACAICQGDLASNKRPHVDHCHKTNKVRGVLCENCNLGLGKFKDNPDTLFSAAAYLTPRLKVA